MWHGSGQRGTGRRRSRPLQRTHQPVPCDLCRDGQSRPRGWAPSGALPPGRGNPDRCRRRGPGDALQASRRIDPDEVLCFALPLHEPRPSHAAAARRRMHRQVSQANAGLRPRCGSGQLAGGSGVARDRRGHGSKSQPFPRRTTSSLWRGGSCDTSFRVPQPRQDRDPSAQP